MVEGALNRAVDDATAESQIGAAVGTMSVESANALRSTEQQQSPLADAGGRQLRDEISLESHLKPAFRKKGTHQQSPEPTIYPRSFFESYYN
jgi:hypothetical protein